MKLRSLIVAGSAVIAVCAAAPAVQAQTSLVTGTGTSALSLSVPTAVTAGAGLLVPGSTTNFLASAVEVIAPTGLWALKVGGTDSGSLKRSTTLTPCDSSTNILAAPLRFTSTALAGGTGRSDVAVPGTATPATVANGTSLVNTVTVNYSQAVGVTEAIQAGCVYNNTLTYTVAAS